MAGKKRRKPNKSSNEKKKNDVTMLQNVPKKRRGGDNAKPSSTRRLFLYAFEKTYGNISASCEYAGISRITYYRWIKSNSRVNKKFQERLKALQPQERKLDFFEGRLMELAQQNNAVGATAVIFGLKTLAKRRGYTEKSVLTDKQDYNELQLLKRQIEAGAKERGVTYEEELRLYLNVFGVTLKPEIHQELATELIQ
jgi:hypothetical protein